MSEVETVRVQEIPEGATIVDVREDYEWEAGHVDGAVHVPLNTLPLRFEELDPDEDLYIICRTGGRSWQAAQWLVGQGYSALNVAGGMDQWFEAGKPIVAEGSNAPRIL